MGAQLDEAGRFVDRDKFLAANESYHASIIGLAENEYLSQGFGRLRLREMFMSALRDVPGAPSTVLSNAEELLDSVAAGHTAGAVRAVLSWGSTVRENIHGVMGADGDPSAAGEMSPVGFFEDLSVSTVKDQSSLAGDVDALVAALDARAALEIGITQSLGNWLSKESDREALVTRLRAYTPLVRGTGAAHAARYIRADDAFHRVFLSLLRNQTLFDIYNAMDVPELMRRVLDAAPPSIREVFDDHKGLTDGLRSGDPDLTCAAITEHANRVRSALAAFLTDAAMLALSDPGTAA
jgi:DNA-binding GntR family transcriptional regulator